MESDKYVTLFSNTSQEQYNTNNSSKFRNKFIVPLHLEGDWKVSLLDISFPFNPINVPEQKIGFLIRFSPTSFKRNVDDTSGLELDEEVYFDPDTSPMDSAMSADIRPKYQNKYRSGMLKGGFYSSVVDLAEEITNLFTRLFAYLKESKELQGELCIEYDQCTNQANIFINNLENYPTESDGITSRDLEVLPIKIITKNAELLESILGFDNVTKEEGKNDTNFCLEVTSEDHLSACPCNLKLFNKIYVCTDVIEHQIVGNKSLRLLTSCVIPLKGNYHMISPLPRYHSIVSGYDSVRNLDSVEIELFSNIQTLEYFPGPVNPSDNDIVECTLHFKRSSLLNAFPI